MARRNLLAASALIASAFAVCAPAQAATFFTGNGSSSIVNGTGSFYDSAIPAGMFTDIIEYTVPSAGAADVNVIYFKILSGISNISASFNGEALSFNSLGGNTFAANLSAPVLPGVQKIEVSGNSGGLGSYSGNVTFAAVPELATWLMMIGGVGFTGLALRRRKTAYNVNYAF